MNTDIHESCIELARHNNFLKFSRVVVICQKEFDLDYAHLQVLFQINGVPKSLFDTWYQKTGGLQFLFAQN